MGEALGVVYPATTLQTCKPANLQTCKPANLQTCKPANLQTCIVHLMRNSLNYASWKNSKPLAAVIKPIYSASSAGATLAELDAVENSEWGKKFPTVVGAWRRGWDKGISFFAFPSEVRWVIYTTNAIESVNARLRKIPKTRGHFPVTMRRQS